MKYFFVFFGVLFSALLSSCGSVSVAQKTSLPEQTTSEAEQSSIPIQVQNSAGLPKAAITTTEKLPEPKVLGLIGALAADFSWPTHIDQRDVEKHLSYYKRKPEQLEIFLTRATEFLPLIADQIKARDLPTELAFLPVVESGYMPSVYSPSGAAGLWQIMPATAEYLGFRMDWWFDERLDIQVSTEKALNYLEYLNAQFNGDWQLAISAYNGGEGHVRSRMRRAKSDNFWDLTLKSETEAYLPRLLAIAEILKNPDAYGVKVPNIKMQSPLQELTLEKQVDLRILADSVGIEVDYFTDLNPAFQRWVSPPKGDYKILIPSQKAAEIENQLASLGNNTLSNWDHYKVRSGDTLIDIARQYGVTLRALMAVNELENSRIYERQELLIPISETPSSSPRAPNSVKELYIVQDGDSLWKIGSKNDVAVDDLRRLNNLTSRALIKPGQVLILSERFTGNEKIYQVKAGDSLSKIAARFEVDLSDLRSWNEINRQDLIHPGQILKIRTDG